MRLSRSLARAASRALFEAFESRFVFAAPTGVLLNEVSVNPPGTDQPYEYVELRGVGSPSLQDVYLVNLEGDGTAAGAADFVVNLSSASFGSNGLLMVKSSTGGFIPAAGTTVVTDTQLDSAAAGLENGSSSFLLVYTPSGLTETTDYDAGNDGILELPGDAVILDSVAWSDGGATDLTYVGPSSGTPPVLTGSFVEAATRFPTNDTANEQGSWYYGALAGTNSTTSYTGNTAALSANFPAGGALTPGDLNAPLGVVNYSMSFSAPSYSAGEAVGSVTVTVTRSTFGAITSVDFATSDGTATAGSDYIANSGTLTFAETDTTQTFQITVIDDGDTELTETINLTLSNPTGTNASLGAQSTAVFSIVDNDATGTPAVLLNEIEADPAGTPDNPFEYVELISGAAGQSLNNIYFVGIEGDNNTNLGKAVLVRNLTGSSTGSSKLAIIRASTGHAVIEAGTTVINDATFATSGGVLQNGSHSFLLIYSPNTAITNNQQLGDTTGALNGLPSGAVVLDAVGWSDGSSVDDRVFGGVDFTFPSPSGSNIADAATRIVGNSVGNNVSSWFYGALAGTDPSALAYGSPASANLPSGAVLTPGGANFVGTTDTEPPTVASIVYDFNTSATVPSLTVTFSEPVQPTTLDGTAASSFTVIDRATNLPVSSAAFTLQNVSSTVAKITFNGGAPADGDFKVVVNAGNVKDLANNALATSSSENYSFLQGDATNDRKVNTLDFNALAGNFGPGGKTFSQGDFSFDGNIDSIDFGLLLGQYGKSLPAVPPPAPVASAPLGGLFGSALIGSADEEPLV